MAPLASDLDIYLNRARIYKCPAKGAGLSNQFKQ